MALYGEILRVAQKAAPSMMNKNNQIDTIGRL
jgi:hypothetical protein